MLHQLLPLCQGVAPRQYLLLLAERLLQALLHCCHKHVIAEKVVGEAPSAGAWHRYSRRLQGHTHWPVVSRCAQAMAALVLPPPLHQVWREEDVVDPAR